MRKQLVSIRPELAKSLILLYAFMALVCFVRRVELTEFNVITKQRVLSGIILEILSKKFKEGKCAT